MFLKVLNKGFLDSNTYILGENGAGVVIDPGNPAEDIFAAASEANIKIDYIFLTHTHIDHMQYLDELKEKTNARVVAHKLDEPGFSDPRYNFSTFMGLKKKFSEPDILIDKDVTLTAGDLSFDFIHTPGHTPGSMCIRTGQTIFTGDTIFDGDFGRTDLGYGSQEQLLKSVEKIFALDPELIVYPGHENENSLGNIIKKCRAVFDILC